MTVVTFRTLVAATLLIASAAAAAHTPLYERLGGAAGVAAIADALIDRVAKDPTLGRSFQDVKLEHVKQMLAEQICELSQGPCHYSGDSMRVTHAGHHISEAEFYGMVQDLRDILHERGVPLGATNELLRLLAPMKRDVVDVPAEAK